MATINGIFSTKLRGKVGDVVYRVNGQTNTVSQKPSSVTNPKSRPQQLQRMYMSTAAIAYSQMKAICDHSFENASGKKGNQAEFLRRNVMMLAGQYQSFNYKGNQYMVPNEYIISKGSLRGLGLERINSWVSKVGKPIGAQEAVDWKGILFKSNTLDTLIKNGVEGDVTAKDFVGPTVREFCDAFGLNYGSQITFILNYIPANYSSFEYNREQQLETKFKYCRIVLKATELASPLFAISTTDNGTAETGMIRMLSFKDNVIDAEKSENWDNIRIIWDVRNNRFDFGYSTYDIALNEEQDEAVFTGSNYCGNAIVSYKQDSKWLRSSEKMLIWREDEQGNRDNVVLSYSPSNPKYLNNAAK